VRVENRAKRHKPGGHRRALDEKQDEQFKVFLFA
jgi:hypothetical protein